MEKKITEKKSQQQYKLSREILDIKHFFLYKIPKVTSLPHQIHRHFFKQIHFSLSLNTGLKYVFLKKKRF